MSDYNSTDRLLNFIQLVVEACIAAGFLIGLFPFAYLWSSGWVLPLTVVSLILSFIIRNGTTGFTAVNMFLALASFIPIIGFIPRLIGVFISLMNINLIRIHLR